MVASLVGSVLIMLVTLHPTLNHPKKREAASHLRDSMYAASENGCCGDPVSFDMLEPSRMDVI